jgi:hypothetical protein
MRTRHHVYVIELDPAVWREPKFRRANPDYVAQPGKPCVYVGMTGLDPDTRFDQHKANIKSNRFAYQALNPMPYADAQFMEVDLAIRLREAGFGVWQA